MAKILVVGSSNTDMVVKTERFPNPGETIIGGEFIMFPGGKGANQAVAASRVGGDVIFVTKLGSDVFGDNALKGFQKEGIDVSNITRDNKTASGVALITVNKDGENEIVVAPGANGRLSIEDIEGVIGAIKESDIILVQLEIPQKAVAFLISTCKTLEKKIILNPAPARDLEDEILNGLFLITPNESEAEILTGIRVHSLSEADAAAKVLIKRGVQNVVLTMGASGALFKNKEDMFFIKANNVAVIDTTAAGDVFNGALAVALARQTSWRVAIQFATKAAGISVSRMGAQASAPYLGEL